MSYFYTFRAISQDADFPTMIHFDSTQLSSVRTEKTKKIYVHQQNIQWGKSL